MDTFMTWKSKSGGAAPASIALLSITLLMLAGCADNRETSTAQEQDNTDSSTVQAGDNPLLRSWEGGYGLAPFAEIQTEHFASAFEYASAELLEEVDAIAANQSAPTFANTIVAMERSGEQLQKVVGVMFHLLSTMRTDELSETTRPLIGELSQLNTQVYSNKDLYARVKAIYDRRDALGLAEDQLRLLDEYHRNFVRNGSLVEGEKLVRFKEINKRLSEISTKFGESVTKDTYSDAIFVDDASIIEDLPQPAIDAAKAEAEKREKPEQWAFIPARVSLYPFLQYAKSPELRSELYALYTNRGDRGGETDNNELIRETLKLRQERAEILGYSDHTSFVLETRTAPSEAAIEEFLVQLWEPSLAAAKRDLADMKVLAKEREGISNFQASDWWYYSERIREERYQLDSAAISEYFPVDSVIEGVFALATKLFGLTFNEIEGEQVWEETVRVYRVDDRDGNFVGIYYADFYARPSKRGGAWMNSFRDQSTFDGTVYPVVFNVTNFPQPSGDKPALLSLEQTTTFFHEFGHALHGLLSDVRYPGQAGTSVPRDFVEFPSQVYENWTLEPEFLPTYAKHYESQRPIPSELIASIQRAGRHNLGFRRVEYLAASLLDLKLHALRGKIGNVSATEERILRNIGAIDEIVPRYRPTYFQHIFSGGYSSGYYSYAWAEVLDADAFSLFQQRGLFDQATAQGFVDHVLSIGGSKDVLTEYEKFLGRPVSVDALLRRDGFIE